MYRDYGKWKLDPQEAERIKLSTLKHVDAKNVNLTIKLVT